MREYKEVRLRLGGDTVAAQALIGQARTLLGKLKVHMATSGLTSLSRGYDFPDGTHIQVHSAMGQDTVSISVPEEVPAVIEAQAQGGAEVPTEETFTPPPEETFAPPEEAYAPPPEGSFAPPEGSFAPPGEPEIEEGHISLEVEDIVRYADAAVVAQDEAPPVLEVPKPEGQAYSFWIVGGTFTIILRQWDIDTGFTGNEIPISYGDTTIRALIMFAGYVWGVETILGAVTKQVIFRISISSKVRQDIATYVTGGYSAVTVTPRGVLFGFITDTNLKFVLVDADGAVVFDTAAAQAASAYIITSFINDGVSAYFRHISHGVAWEDRIMRIDLVSGAAVEIYQAIADIDPPGLNQLCYGIAALGGGNMVSIDYHDLSGNALAPRISIRVPVASGPMDFGGIGAANTSSTDSGVVAMAASGAIVAINANPYYGEGGVGDTRASRVAAVIRNSATPAVEFLDAETVLPGLRPLATLRQTVSVLPDPAGNTIAVIGSDAETAAVMYLYNIETGVTKVGNFALADIARGYLLQIHLDTPGTALDARGSPITPEWAYLGHTNAGYAYFF